MGETHWIVLIQMQNLKILIQAIYDEHEGRYGYRRIRDELANRGHTSKS